MDELLRQFTQYSRVVNAERYRVTAVRFIEDGSKKAFVLGKSEGLDLGFSAEELPLHFSEMLRLQNRGENLYYTPISTGQHHIVVDDLNEPELGLLQSDGYRPAIILESSPNNFQAIITITKFQSDRDREIGNALARRLNKEYGDPNFSGAVHPHRAPGFENRKPKHRRPDGSYPSVRIVQTLGGECENTMALAVEIRSELESKKTSSNPVSSVPVFSPRAGGRGVSASIYSRHYEDIRQRTGATDLSRVDSMIAIRMRVTGHTQGEIESTIRAYAPSIRPSKKKEERNWDDYARRVVLFAFSAEGDRQIGELEKYGRWWLTLEEWVKPA